VRADDWGLNRKAKAQSPQPGACLPYEIINL
jgi:hypothetical protein